MARFKAIAVLRRKRPTDEVLRDLPESYREPVVLRDIEQLPYDELSRRLGLNVNTAKARVARGRALVAARLGDR